VITEKTILAINTIGCILETIGGVIVFAFSSKLMSGFTNLPNKLFNIAGYCLVLIGLILQLFVNIFYK
jgi:uncharacterized protein YjeT (DUF2065 family)